MAEPPPPPFQINMSEQARDDLDRQPELAASANAALLRAAKQVRTELEMGQNVARDVFGERENVTVRVSLVPPDIVRIEGVESGGPVPEAAIVV